MREHAEKRTGRSRRLSDQQTAEALDQTEARLEAVLAWTDTGVSTTDADGRVVQSNPALRAMLGYNEEELQGMSFTDFTHPEDLGVEHALFAELMAGKRDQYHLEKRYIRKGGEILWGRLTVALVDATAGERRLMVAMVEDMTQQMRADEILRAEEQFQKVLMQLSILANATLDMDVMLRQICDAATGAFGMSGVCIFLLDGSAGLTLAASTLPNVALGSAVPVAADALATVRSIQQRRPLYNNQIPADIPDEVGALMARAGVRSVLAAPIFIGDTVQGALALVSDESNRFTDADLSDARQVAQVIGGALRNAQLYRQEQTVAERLRQMEQQRTGFLRIMAHELRTPLGHIIGFTDLVSAEASLLSERSQRYLAHAQAAAATLQALMQRSFDLVALYGEEHVAQRDQMLLTSVVETALETYRERILGKRLELRYVPPIHQVATRGQPEQVRQVIEILLDNAIKFAPAGGMVEIEVTRVDGEFAIAIWDSGPAVPADMADHIFVGQAEDALTRHHGGAGLSLLMARRIAELHGGQLTLEPVERGARFVLTLPADA
jgi:PAS domain S-box-containing protein